MGGERRRIWSEHVPFEQLCLPEVLRPLAVRRLQLLIAIQPGALSAMPAVLEACDREGVEVGLWPLLDDGLGRWPGDTNLPAFRAHLLAMLEVVGAGDREVVFDLEPPIATTRRVLSLRLWNGRVRLRPAAIDAAAERLDELTGEVRRRGMTPIAVVPPMVLGDPKGRRGGWQRLLGTPVDGVGFEQVMVMAYTSLFEGYARGGLSRRDTRALLAQLCRLARQRWGSRASVALGVVGGGALGDEAPYREAAELVDDVAIALAAGVGDLALFGLTGVLSRPGEPERWLDALVETAPATRVPGPTPRSWAVMLGVVGAGRFFDRISRSLPVVPR